MDSEENTCVGVEDHDLPEHEEGYIQIIPGVFYLFLVYD